MKITSFLWDQALMIRHIRSWQYRKANYMYYCKDCKEYSRQYHMELKNLSCDEYKSVKSQLERGSFGVLPDICPHCYSTNIAGFGHNDVKGLRRPWLDFDFKAPKMDIKNFIQYQKTINKVSINTTDIKEIEHYLQHNGLT